MNKAEFWRQWAIEGMPGDKKRLADAAWNAAIDAAFDAVDSADHDSDGSSINAGYATLEAVEKLKRHNTLPDRASDSWSTAAACYDSTKARYDVRRTESAASRCPHCRYGQKR